MVSVIRKRNATNHTTTLITKNKTMNRQKVLSNSTIGKILSGNTRGIHNWYVQKILNQKWLYEVTDNK